VLERDVDVAPDLVWKAWTEPKHLMPWFCPVPWKVTQCGIDLRPGGRFFTLMEGPGGGKVPNEGCYLEVVPKSRLVWTDAIHAGWRPAAKPFMTGALSIEPKGKGTRYTAMALHADERSRKQHEQMGFHEGWGKALDQLVALMRRK
jgi:uncharacterized protein YndB with AHSA1/START domain